METRIRTHINESLVYYIALQSLSCGRLFATPWTVAHQASLSFTVSLSLLKLTSTESVMPSNHLVLCHPLLLFICRRPKQKLKISTSSQPKDTGHASKSPGTRQIIRVSTLEAGLVLGGISAGERQAASLVSLPNTCWCQYFSSSATFQGIVKLSKFFQMAFSRGSPGKKSFFFLFF